MFCAKCGNRLEDNDRFCQECGAPVRGAESEIQEDARVPSAGKPTFPKKFSRKPGLIAAALALLVVLLVGAGVLFNELRMQYREKKLSEAIEVCGISDAEKQRTQLEEQWNSAGLFDFSEKKRLLGELTDLKEEAEEQSGILDEISAKLADYEDKKEKCCLAGDMAAYEDALEACGKALEERNPKAARKAFGKTESAFQAVLDSSRQYVDEKLEEYKTAKMEKASAEDAETYDTYMEEITKLCEKEEYKKLASVFEKMDEVVFPYLVPDHVLNIQVQQVDLSTYPHVKLYMNVSNQDTGNVPDDLETGMFYIRKKDANGDYIRREVTRVSQLNELEALNVGMVADVSGSMSGTPLADAKNIMEQFVNSVQFNAGDSVELTSFSNGVYLEQEFTNDQNALINHIRNLSTRDMTSLYDALYASVVRTAAMTGAKCVIAFTDGMDNYSSCTVQEVIDAAVRYHVPVFIIGIGDAEYYTDVRTIAEKTGGEYYSVYDVRGMSSIYGEIYRKEKEMYLLEFEDNDATDLCSTADVVVGYHSGKYGGECTYSYTPNVMLNVNGESIFSDGPEAVVEKYMRAFDSAVTQSDFSKIEPYLKPGSNIYTTQQKYVLRDISEMLYSYEIAAVDYSDSSSCIVTTRETYYVQLPGKPLNLMTQICKYLVKKEGTDWKMVDFAEKVNVISKLNQ